MALDGSRTPVILYGMHGMNPKIMRMGVVENGDYYADIFTTHLHCKKISCVLCAISLINRSSVTYELRDWLNQSSSLRCRWAPLGPRIRPGWKHPVFQTRLIRKNRKNVFQVLPLSKKYSPLKNIFLHYIFNIS